MNKTKSCKILEQHKDAVISSMVEYIQKRPYCIRTLDGKLEKRDDTDRIKECKQKAINVIRNAHDYRFHLGYYDNYVLSERYYLELCFGNDYYEEYLVMFNLWDRKSEDCHIFNYINTAFQTAIKYHVEKRETSINGVFIPQNKNLHKISITDAYHEDRAKFLITSNSSEVFKDAIERMLRSLKIKDYSQAISDARASVESFTKHQLSKEEINNKTDHISLFKSVLKETILLPTNATNYEKGKEALEAVVEGINSALNGLAMLRNLYGVSHGQSESHINLDEHHARLAVGCAILFMDFITSAKQKVS